MDMLASVNSVRQHLIDPETCARCSGCEFACPKRAISHDSNVFVIDPAKCDDCGTCLEECQTGAINSWRYVPVGQAYPLAEQFGWNSLPPQNPAYEITAGNERLRTQALHAPRTAATPATNLYNAQLPLKATLISNQTFGADADGNVHHLVFEVEQGSLPLLEGQSLGVLPPGGDMASPHHMRLYSVASSRDGEVPGAEQFALTVKRVLRSADGQYIPGVCSNFLADLIPGETAEIVGPFGETFLMPNDNSPMIMIATGVGIAPMRGMIERRMRTGASARNILYYGGRTRSQMAYLNAFEEISADGQLELRTALSRDPVATKQYVQHLVDADFERLADLLLEKNAHLYICGVRGLASELSDVFTRHLAERGRDWNDVRAALIAEGRYHIEVF